MKKVLLVIFGHLSATSGVALAQNTPSNSIDLGWFGDGLSAIRFNTFDSAIDTELGVFDASGAVIATSDNANGTLQSEIVILQRLAPGNYYVAAAEYPTTFGAGFFAGGGPSGDRITLNYGLDQTAEGPILDGALWFRFRIGPQEPPQVNVMGVESPNPRTLIMLVQTHEGFSYRMQRSRYLRVWTNVGPLFSGDGTVQRFTWPRGPNSGFMRVVIP